MSSTVTRARGGQELGYQEITSAFSVTRAGTDVTSNITNLSVPNVTIPSGGIIITAGSAFLQHTAAGGAARVGIFDGSTELARQQLFIPGTGTASFAAPWGIFRKITSYTPGSVVTFQAKLSSLFVAGNAVIDAQTFQPAWLRIVAAT